MVFGYLQTVGTEGEQKPSSVVEAFQYFWFSDC